jgi:tRNA A-37 threonylcarbamoyl transferase component Bud32
MILAFERLPGGWYGVAMDYHKSSVPITRSSMLVSHRDRWMTELRHLMAAFHGRDLVHGDLRDANIICLETCVMLIDFD